jgi:hypothetical protein
MISVPLFLLFPLTFFLTLAVSLGLRRLAPTMGLADGTTATVGGAGVFLAWSTALAFAATPEDAEMGNFTFLATALFLVVAGLAADRWKAGRAARFALMAAAAALLVLWHGTTLPLGLGKATAPVTILLVFIVLKAWDMISDRNGQAEGVTIGAMIWILLLGFSAGETLEGQKAPLLLIAAIAGIVPLVAGLFSAQGRAIRIGQAGGLFLGLATAWLAFTLPGDALKIAPVTIAWILAYPLFDMAGTVLRRLAAGESPFSHSKRHLHDLLSATYGERRTAHLVIRMSFFYGGIGYLGWCWHVPAPYMAGAWLGALALQFLLSLRINPKNLK